MIRFLSLLMLVVLFGCGVQDAQTEGPPAPTGWVPPPTPEQLQLYGAPTVPELRQTAPALFTDEDEQKK